MKTWRMIIDVARCIDCNDCALACKDEHAENGWPGYTLPQPRHGQRWIDIQRSERGQHPLVDVAYMPVLCMNCADAPCIPASGGAISRRDDGIVLIDQDKAKDNRHLLMACPYGQIWWNDAERTAQMCTFCAHLIDQGWKQTRCVQACPTGALQVEFIDDEAMERKVKAEGLEQLRPEFGARPQVYYKNLYRFNTCMLAGSVAVQKDGILDCLPGVEIALFHEGRQIAKTLTDTFGDFRFDRLASGKAYKVQIAAKGKETKTVSVEKMEKGSSLGTILI